MWKRLVGKTATDSLGWEAELSFTYKTPAWIEFSLAKILWILTLYYWIYYTFFLGDQTQAFWDRSFTSPWDKRTGDQYIPRYEMTYLFDRPQLR